MLCHDLPCPLVTKGNICPRYPIPYMFLVERRGYCPVIDTYTDPEKQVAYEKAKKAADKVRVGQQHQVTSEEGIFIRRKK